MTMLIKIHKEESRAHQKCMCFHWALPLIGHGSVVLETPILPGGGILVDGVAKTTNPLVLSVTLGSQQVASIQFPLSIDKISNMYRWVNLRGATAGGNSVRATATGIPSNYPDANSNGKMVVFVHGFNVAEVQFPAWCAEAFKRLYQRGANSMFTGICWNGNANGIDYWQNVCNAFGTSAALIQAVSSLPGGTNKIIMAHSLGNMVVSSALSDFGSNGLKVSQYFMIDAAVPMEAFDTSTFPNANMYNTNYNGYNTNLWASYWYTVFTPSDGRHNLTWQNRLTNALTIQPVSFYSSGEEVLANGTPSQLVPSILTTAETFGGYAPDAWYIQEMTKGTQLGTALIYAVGCNNIGVFGNNNIDMMLTKEDGWPSVRPLSNDLIHRRWFHSDAKDVAYPFTHKNYGSN